jgi:hypothetical protein
MCPRRLLGVLIEERYLPVGTGIFAEHLARERIYHVRRYPALGRRGTPAT